MLGFTIFALLMVLAAVIIIYTKETDKLWGENKKLYADSDKLEKLLRESQDNNAALMAVNKRLLEEAQELAKAKSVKELLDKSFLEKLQADAKFMHQTLLQTEVKLNALYVEYTALLDAFSETLAKDIEE